MYITFFEGLLIAGLMLTAVLLIIILMPVGIYKLMRAVMREIKLERAMKKRGDK